MKTLAKSLVTLCMASALLLLPRAAFAVSGVVTGKVTLYVNQGQYCDTTIGMDCTAAHYLRAHNTILSGVAQPIREARVELADQNGTVIGVSGSDANGNFSISWTRSTTPTSATLRWAYRHIDSRFWVSASTAPDSPYWSGTSSFAVVAGGTKDAGTFMWGDMEIRQAYHSAERAWYEAFRYSSVGANTFSQVRIIPNHPSAGPNTGFVDQVPSNRQVKLGTNSTRYPIAVLHHEMGHMFHYLAQPAIKFTPIYNYPTPCTAASPNGCWGGGHSVDSAEWKAASFSEGLASFLGTNPSYWHWAPQPQWCYATVSACGNTGWNQEVRPAGACAANEHRQELTLQRYLWDLYDSVNDAAYDDATGENTHAAFWFATLASELGTYGSGIENGHANEPWSTTALTTISPTKQDERAGLDYKAKLNQAANLQHTNNCSP
jgi:hypothetical protein